MPDSTGKVDSMEEGILLRLAERLDAPKKEDDGYKFKNIPDMLLFLDIANRLKHIEISEDYFLMSVLITPMPCQIDPHARIDSFLARLDVHASSIKRDKKELADIRRRIDGLKR